MTSSDLELILDRIEKTIDRKIETKVNGGVVHLTELVNEHNAKHEADMKEVREHIEEVKPILEAYNGTKAIGNLAKWVGGIIITVAAAWAIIFNK